MDDAADVRFVQSVRNLCRNSERLAQIWQVALEPRSQGFPFNVLKDYEALIALLPNLIDGAYVRVIESGCRLGLRQKTLFSALIGGDFSEEEFNSDFPVKLLVLSQVDLAHAAASELFYDAVVRDGLSDHWRESYVCETGKSMKAMQLAVPRKGCCCKIAVTLIDTDFGE